MIDEDGGGEAEEGSGGADLAPGGGVLNTTAAPPHGFVIGISQATDR